MTEEKFRAKVFNDMVSKVDDGLQKALTAPNLPLDVKGELTELQGYTAALRAMEFDSTVHASKTPVPGTPVAQLKVVTSSTPTVTITAPVTSVAPPVPGIVETEVPK